MNETATTVEERFWAKVDKTSNPNGCWEWTASKVQTGYGKFWYRGKLSPTHRIVLMMAGAELAPENFVCHRCDNRPCCNPDHLFIGTAADNSSDMVRKGRSARGPERPNTKLTEAMVAEIRDLLKTSESQSHIASRFGVSQATISKIAVGKVWAWTLRDRSV